MICFSRTYIAAVAEAKELKQTSLTNTADPYAVIRIDGEEKARTPTKFNESSNPVWLQEYTL